MERLTFVFFVYGLAFFAMGLAIALESRRPSDLRLSRPLRYLAAFGLLHAAVEWLDMWLIGPGGGAMTAATLRILRIVLFAVSTVALAQFGADLIALIRPTLRFVRWVPMVLLVFWTANLAVIPHLADVPPGAVARSGSCTRCHTVEVPAPDAALARPPVGPATALADVWLRYTIYLPGSILAAVGFWMEGRRLATGGYAFIAQDCRWTALAFVANALMAGLVVPPAPVFPASVLNYDRFLSVIGVPPQLIRAVIAVVIAGLTLRVLRVFEAEATGRLAKATEALAAVQAARAEAEMSSRTLEDRVAARTAELERRTRELAALNTIAATVTSSLDLHTVLEETVDQVLAMVGGDGGGVTLFAASPGGPSVRVIRGPAGEQIDRVSGFEPGSTATGAVTFPDDGSTRPFVKVPLRRVNASATLR
jgi:hypothetical protein